MHVNIYKEVQQNDEHLNGLTIHTIDGFPMTKAEERQYIKAI